MAGDPPQAVQGKCLEGLETPGRVKEPLGEVSATRGPLHPGHEASCVLLPSRLFGRASGSPGSKGWAQGLGQRRQGPTRGTQRPAQGCGPASPMRITGDSWPACAGSRGGSDGQGRAQACGSHCGLGRARQMQSLGNSQGICAVAQTGPGTWGGAGPPQGRRPRWEAAATRRGTSGEALRQQLPGPAMGTLGLPMRALPRPPQPAAGSVLWRPPRPFPRLCPGQASPSPLWGEVCGETLRVPRAAPWRDRGELGAAGVSFLPREACELWQRSGQTGGMWGRGHPNPHPLVSQCGPSSAWGRQQPYVGRGAVCPAAWPRGPSLAGPVTDDFPCLSGRPASGRGRGVAQPSCQLQVPPWLS